MAEPTSFDIVTLVIAVIGAVAGVAALIWNVVRFRLEGARIVASIQASIRHTSGTGAIVGGEDVWKSRNEGYDIPSVCVTATNKGRFSATIGQISVQADKLGLVPIGELVGPPLPHRLQPYESVSWHIELRSVVALVDSAVAVLNARRKPVTAELSLGDGTTVKSKTSLRVPAMD